MKAPPSTTLNISMPSTMRRFIERRTREGNFATPTEYVRSLIRDDIARSNQDDLEKQLKAGLESGAVIDASGDAFWQERIARLKRMPKRAKKAS
jgi:antitoxin ParD1/3/4